MGVYPDSFPTDFETRVLPAEASPTAHIAYRVAKYGAKDPRSYLCSWDEYNLERRDTSTLLEKDEAERFSTSLCDKREPLEYLLKISMRHHPCPEVVVGVTAPSCGPSLVGVEQKRRTKNGDSIYHHISWWIYKDAAP